jgi:hypothetical protein
MSSSPGDDRWSSSRRSAPTVRIVTSGTAGSGLPARSAAAEPHYGGSAYSATAMISMSLLLASTSLALYDLYVLTSAFAGGG